MAADPQPPAPPALHRTVEGGGPVRVVLVHGFTQTLRSWDPVVAELGGGYEVVRVDLPGHGGSSRVGAGFVEAAAAVGEAGGPAVYVGYSMGGRLCLRLAADRPDLVRALVTVGASPGLADPGERRARQAADDELAAAIERSGTVTFLERWLAQPLFEGFTPDPGDLAARRANPPEGLAAALRSMGTGGQEPLWPRLGQLAMPVLAVAGETDRRYVDLARRMADAIGANASVAVVAGAGHAAHLTRPDRFAELVGAFLGAHPTTR